MKINERSALNTSKPDSTRLYETQTPAGKSSPAAGPVQDTGDKIDLGSQATLLSRAQATDSSERSSNTERLRALIQSGQYQMNPAALSSSIVSATLDGY
jgi:anti-sigma28 factor (negative regulator of flagellin synthesis)